MRLPARQGGIALTIVLWVITLLTVIAANFSYTMKTDTLQARSQLDRLKARHLAEAGVRQAIWQLTHPDQAQRWLSDGRSYSLQLGASEQHVSVIRETGLIDLNNAPANMLSGLLRVGGASPQQADEIAVAILDWRDEDQLRQLNGAEDNDYVAMGRTHGAGDAPFISVTQLRQVKGMNASLYEKVAPFLTLHTGLGSVDLNNAPREVILAQPGMEANRVAQMIQARENNNIATPNLNTNAVNMYRIRVESHMPGGVIFANTAVVHLLSAKQNGYRILEWHEG